MMSNKQWHVGIIGLGGIGDYHMNNLAKITIQTLPPSVM
jgi:tRNA A37 threonylcarbamoyladenosine dehydratase